MKKANNKYLLSLSDENIEYIDEYANRLGMFRTQALNVLIDNMKNQDKIIQEQRILLEHYNEIIRHENPSL